MSFISRAIYIYIYIFKRTLDEIFNFTILRFEIMWLGYKKDIHKNLLARCLMYLVIISMNILIETFMCTILLHFITSRVNQNCQYSLLTGKYYYKEHSESNCKNSPVTG